MTILDEEFYQAGLPRVDRVQGESMVGPSIILHGTDEQKAYYLPRIISGEHRYCQGFSEPGFRIRSGVGRTRGIVDGDQLSITGQKVWTSRFGIANMIFVLCRTDPAAKKHRGLSYAITEFTPGHNGIEVRPIRQITGAEEFAEVFFDGTVAPLSGVIGGLGNGWQVVQSTLGFERGGAGRATTMVLQARERELEQLVTLARRTGKHRDPSVRRELAWAKTQVVIMRSSWQRTVAEVAAGGPAGPADVDVETRLERIPSAARRTRPRDRRPGRSAAAGRDRITPSTPGRTPSWSRIRGRSTPVPVRCSATSSARVCWACPVSPGCPKGALMSMTPKESASTFEFPVERGQIMMFARALSDDNPIYFDEGHRQTALRGGVVAPPTFVACAAQFDPDWPYRPRPGARVERLGPRTRCCPSLVRRRHQSACRTALRIPCAAASRRRLDCSREAGKTWEKHSPRGGTLRFSEEITRFVNQRRGACGHCPAGSGGYRAAGGPMRIAELAVGDQHEARSRAELSRTQIVMYAGASGDYNPLHTDEVYATKVAGYPSVIAHGQLTMGLTAKVDDRLDRGRRTQRFRGAVSRQVWPGDTLTTRATVSSVEDGDGSVAVDLDIVTVNRTVSRWSRATPGCGRWASAWMSDWRWSPAAAAVLDRRSAVRWPATVSTSR